ncbi:LysM domain-containing protein [Cellulosimicrobium terreum]|nr:LysM domain-containing protein [Cellulosimicrobium terreum]
MSRYDDVETATLEVTAPDGTRRLVRYLRRRPLPPPVDVEGPAALHTVVPGDRLDLLSYRYTGDPLGFWRLCDANAALDPDALTDAEAVGTEIVVPQPGVSGR